MRKVAIATMTGGSNYGNALQNYAVLNLIEKCGYDAETLNVTTTNGYPDSISEEASFFRKLYPSYVLSWYRTKLYGKYGTKNDGDFRLSSLRKIENNRSNWVKAKIKKQKVFNDFQKEILRYTDFEVNNKYFNIEKIQDYSAFVTGSDQVWNPYYRTNSMVEFLQMVPKEKRIAFAPSFGVSAIPECRKEEYKEWLNVIPYLSVREDDGAKIIKELTGRDAEVLLDPTFGLAKEEWTNFSKKPDDFTCKTDSYVFCYFLGKRTKAYTNYIKKYAEQHDCSIVDVYDVTQLNNYAYSPQEFVWLLANAKAVFTDSFHGCAFSINMEKPFVVFDRAGDGCITQSSRLTTVLKKVGLENRMFKKIPVENVDFIEFDNVLNKVTSEREKMLQYLKISLDEVISKNPSITLATKRHCTGCGACKNVCPKDAITMKQDEEGFLYPFIDTKQCINCHACEKACPSDKTNKAEEKTEAYYAFTNNSDICKKSSSGGIFSELAISIINNGGIVFGAGYDKEFNVCHMSAENEIELENLRTSKYVQSDISYTFREVLKQLNTGRKVLFSGAPCQIVALKSYIKKDYENLYLIDIICHGVPSPKIWREYLDQEHKDKEIESVSFRNKDLGWNDFSMKINYKDGSFYRELATKDPYERAFLSNLTLRPSCYQCQYKTVERVSDITLADYWGVETVHPELKEQQGVSLVLVHGNKGKELVKSLKNITFNETDIAKAVSMNSACLHSVPWPEKRNEFFRLEKEIGVKKAVDICLKESAQDIIKKFVVRNGSRVKRVLRKLRIIR